MASFLQQFRQLCDRILVLCGGKITGILDGRTAQKDEVGLLMTKHIEDDSEIVKDDVQENNETEEVKEDGTSEA